ncbi:MAG: DUF883 domain-containing protein [Rhodobacterales bacterium]|nr:DUF883 domain-containing protein [Rhodobacterales bacterium]
MATAKTPTIEDLSEQLEALKADIATLTHTIGDIGRSKGEEVAGTLRGQAEAARDAGAAQIADVQRQLVSGAHDAEDYVRRNPATALGIAAGVGVLVGLISARR